MIPEREREALMRLTMCARGECPMCKYEEQCDNWDFRMELATKNMNILAEALRKDDPQTNADQHVQRVEYVGNDKRIRCWKCKHFESIHETPISSDGRYYTYVVCTASKCHYEPKDEPQTDKLTLEEALTLSLEEALSTCKERHGGCENCYAECAWREPQTERSE